ncbi:MAG: hypothetical protein E6J14_15610 [Chloroflexi bacterium]|nr:MAG: hypothetical protein E6J14_15610 [Chloroflexota bacterium]
MSPTPLPADQYTSAGIAAELTADEVASQLERQRFDAELSARQSRIKQLQLELDAARAEHAAALADRERRIAERERELVEALSRRRGFFRRR